MTAVVRSHNSRVSGCIEVLSQLGDPGVRESKECLVLKLVTESKVTECWDLPGTVLSTKHSLMSTYNRQSRLKIEFCGAFDLLFLYTLHSLLEVVVLKGSTSFISI